MNIDSSGRLDRRSTLCLIGGAGGGALLTSYCFAHTGQSAADRIRRGDEFGLRSDGRDDEGRALQAAMDRLAVGGGGELLLQRGGVTVAKAGLIVPADVTLNLNGGTLQLRLQAANATGVRLRSRATLRNGTIIVRSTGHPSLQAGVHAPVIVGPIYGEGGTPHRLSPDEGVSGWAIRDLTLLSDKSADAGGGNSVGAVAIQIVGGAHAGLIENIHVPDNPHMTGGVHMDWGFVGPISSPTIPQNAVHYRAGRGYTTHPHNIVVRNIRIGRLSRPLTSAGGSFGIRLSGVYNIDVDNVLVDSVTDAAFYHTAGDLGFEFAQAAVKPHACRGIRISNGQVADGSTAYLIQSDSWADNIGRETLHGYRPMMDPIHSTDISFTNIRGIAQNLARANFGVRVQHQRGGRIVDCVAQGYKRGFYIDEQVDGLTLVRPTALDSAEFGISVEHPTNPPRNVLIENPIARGNGRAAGSMLASGILVGRSENVKVVGGQVPKGGLQRRAIRFTPEARNASASAGAAPLVSRE